MTRVAEIDLSRPQGLQGRVFVVIPVFNRWRFTRDCIEGLRQQTYPLVTIIISDGGSTDETRSALRLCDDVVLVCDDKPRWWTGSTELGIEEALRRGQDDDFVLLLNNDTQIPPDYIETLVRCSNKHNAAVGAVVVDSRDPSIVLDAGEFIDWKSYSFPVKTEIAAGEKFFDGVDTLPGRGSLIPMRIIRIVGNVDAKTFPHYIADYDFFCRVKAAGFRLGVCYETRILAHIEETGIVPTTEMKSFREIHRAIFSRRSMSNFSDHWRFISRHAPATERARLRRGLVIQSFRRVVYETRLRIILNGLKAVRRSLPVRIIWTLIRWTRDPDMVFGAFGLPRPWRQVAAMLILPRAFKADEAKQFGLDPEGLVAAGIFKATRVAGWYSFATLKWPRHPYRGALGDLLHLVRQTTMAKYRSIKEFQTALYALPGEAEISGQRERAQ